MSSQVTQNNPISLQVARRRISKQQRILIAEYLDEKYGHKCAYGEETAKLQIDHKNGDRNDTRLVNLAWACSRHQKVRTVASQSISLSTSENQFETPLAKNQSSEPRFVVWSKEWVKTHSATPLKVFCREAAIPCKCHPKTIEGYVEKWSGSKGHLIVTENRVKEKFVEARSLYEASDERLS